MSVPGWPSLGGEGLNYREPFEGMSQEGSQISLPLRSHKVGMSTSASDLSTDSLAAYFDSKLLTLDSNTRAVMNNIIPGDPSSQSELVSFVGDKQLGSHRKLGGVEDDVFSAVGGLELGHDAEQDFHLSDRAGSGPASTIPSLEQQLSQQPSRTLFVRNLGNDVSDDDIRTLYRAYGDIRNLYTACKHRGFITVTYFDLRDAMNAMASLQNATFANCKLEMVYVSKAAAQESGVNQGTIVVFNLDPDTSNEKLVWLFSKFGDVKEIRESPTRRNQKFIEFFDIRHAAAALRAMNRAEQLGKVPVQAANVQPPLSYLSENQYDTKGHASRPSSSLLQAPMSQSWDPSFTASVENLYNLVSQATASAQLQANQPYSELPVQLNSAASNMASLKYSTSGRGGLHVSDSASSMVNSQVVTSQAAGTFYPSGTSPGMLGAGALPNFAQRPPGTASFGSPNFNRPEFLYHHTPATAEALVGGNAPDFAESLENLAARDAASYMATVEGQQLWNAHLGLPKSPNSPSTIWGAGLYSGTGPAGGMPGMNAALQDWQTRQHLALAGLQNFQHPLVDLTPANILLAASLQQHLGQFAPRNASAIPMAQGGQGMSVLPPQGNLGGKSASAGSLGSVGSSDRAREQARSGGRLSRRNADPAAEAERKAQQEKLYALDVDKINSGEDKRTTLMIKNIPNKYTQKMLLSTIDELFRGSYDFFYLPIDFKNKCNVGYAFINLIRPEHIIPLFEKFHLKKWERFNSEKVCHISYARIQGRNSLIAHFQNSSLMHEDKRCRPILFTTDGSEAGEQEPFPVGPNVRARVGYSYREKGKERDK